MPTLNEDIYIKTPRGHPMHNKELFLKTQQTLYGLKQAGREWKWDTEQHTQKDGASED